MVSLINAACPAGLVYAEEVFSCVNFQFAVLTKELSAETVTNYSEEMTAKINAGELYDFVKANYPETYIYGLGNPGAGTFNDGNTDSTAAPGEPAVTTAAPDAVVEEPAPIVEEPAPEQTGLGAVAIVLIVLAVVIVPIAIVRVRQYEAILKISQDQGRGDRRTHSSIRGNLVPASC
jgi:hypothetical protein